MDDIRIPNAAARTVTLIAVLLVCGCLDTSKDPDFGKHPDSGSGGHSGQGSSGSSSPAGQGGDSGSSGESGRDGGSGSSGTGMDGGAGTAAGMGGSGTGGSGGSGISGADGGESGTDGSTDAGDAGQDESHCRWGCSGNTPVCYEAAYRCVACLESKDCPDFQVCTPLRQCVECNEDADCGDFAHARCDVNRHTCLSCNLDAQCTKFSDTPVCDESSGSCVECTKDTEAAHCTNGKACIKSTGTCTGATRQTVLPCGGCQADSECVDNTKCVEDFFGDPAQSVGHFCFYKKNPNCGNADVGRRPYSQEVNARSIDGTQNETFCLPITTCEAVQDAIGNLSGPTECDGDGDCGVSGTADGHCIVTGTAMGRCSYTCVSANDCSTNTLSACLPDDPDAGSTTYCQPPP